MTKIKIEMYGADWCPDCRRAKSFLQDNNVEFSFIDIDKDNTAVKKVEEINNGKRIIPTIIINEVAHTNPDNAELMSLLNIKEATDNKIYDVIVVGAGAAGLTTSIYSQRDRFDTLVLEKKNIGGNAFLTEKIENYPGFTTISGPKLMEKMFEQAQTYGADIKQGVEVQEFKKDGSIFNVKTNLGDFKSKSIVFATGSTYRRLKIPGEEELIGSGVHFCATCDGAFYRDKEVIVVGGGNSALEEGIFLANFCSKVKIICRKEEFSASKTYIDKLPDIKNIELYMNKTSLEFLSNEKGLFDSIKLKDNATNKEELLKADGVFVFIGLIPNTQFLEGLLELDTRGFIATDCASAKTKTTGIFAAGDCRSGAIAQVAAATGEGVLASYAIKSFLSE